MGTFTNLAIGQGRRLYVSGTCESAWASSAAPPSITHALIHFCGFDPYKVEEDRIKNNKFASGIATDFATRHLVRGRKGAWNPEFLGTLECIFWSLAKALGNSYTPASLGGGLYGHTMTMADLPDVLPGFVFQENNGGYTADTGRDIKSLGNAINTWKLTVDETDFAMVSLGLLCSGKVATAVTTAEGGLYISEKGLTLDKFQLWLDGPVADGSIGTSPWDGTHEVGATAGTFPTGDSGATNVSNHLRGGFSIQVDNKAADTRQAGSSQDAGTYQSAPRAGRSGEREVTINAKLVLDDTTEWLLKAAQDSSYTSQKECGIYLNIAGLTDGHGGQINFPLSVLAAAPSGRSGTGEQVMDCTFEARKTSAGTARAIVSAYCVNAENIDYC